MGIAVQALLRRALLIYEYLLEAKTNDEEKLKKLISRVKTILGHLYYKRGDDDHAIQYYKSVEDAYNAGCGDVSTASALESLGVISWERGDVWRAEQLFEEALGAISVPHTEVDKRVRLLLQGLRNGDKTHLEKLQRKNVFEMF